MIRATGKLGDRTIELAIVRETRTLWVRTEHDLWDTETFTTVDECFGSAERRFGVSKYAWQQSEFTLTDMMQAYAMDAWEMARDRYSTVLDFSDESVRKAEEILGRIFDQRPTGLKKLLMGKQYEQSLDGLSKAWGGYLGEAIRRQVGGEWTLADELFPGQRVVALKWDDQSMCFPPAKVHQRLTNGSEDNVAIFCRVTVDERRAKTEVPRT